jgi:hypothetical protein
MNFRQDSEHFVIIAINVFGRMDDVFMKDQRLKQVDLVMNT